MKKLLLLIEDDPAIQSWMKESLPQNLFLLETALTGREGLDLILQRKPDLVLLDWNIPGWNGLELCKYIRQTKSIAHTPVIMLTGYDDVQRKLAAFSAGADDYLTKPFELEELFARVRAVLRRNDVAPDDIISREGITLNLTGYSVQVDKKVLALTSTEFNLLHMLMKCPGRILTRKFLLEHIWGYALDISTRTVDVYVRRLRKKLGTRRALAIISVPGFGYKFKGNPSLAPLPNESVPYIKKTAVRMTSAFERTALHSA